MGVRPARARGWGNEEFGSFAPWEEVCLAAEQHDVGMAAWDAHPTLNEATGLPHSFQELPRQTHVSLWRSAAGIVLPQSRYAALLVSLHGTGLYEAYEPAGGSAEDNLAVRRYLASERRFQDALLQSLRSDSRHAPYATEAVLVRNTRLVARCDGISLALCHALRIEHAHEGVPAADGETTITVTPIDGRQDEYVMNPWPFRDEKLSLLYEGRRLAGTFTDPDEMRSALDHAPWVSLTTRLCRA